MRTLMSYQVLARKYRPRQLQDVVGQDHTVRALVNSLDAGRLQFARALAMVVLPTPRVPVKR